MKKNALSYMFLAFTALALTFTFQSCVNEDLDQENQLNKVENEVNDNSEVLEMIRSMGFDTKNAIELEHYFIIEGDLKFSKDIKDYSDSPEMAARHYHKRNLVADEIIGGCGDNPRSGIRVFLDIPNNQNWTNAVNSAIADWNTAVNPRVLFELAPIGNADIIITPFPPASMNNNALAGLSGNPSCGRPYYEVLIEPNYIIPQDQQPLTAVQRRNLIGHELGHAIGFWHTDSSGPNGTVVPGTEEVENDNLSIMHLDILNRSNVGLSSRDILATQYLYGCNSTINPDNTYSSNFSDVIIKPKKYTCDTFHITGKFEVCFSPANFITWVQGVNTTEVTLSIYDTDFPFNNTALATISTNFSTSNGNFNFSDINLNNLGFNFVSGNDYYAVVSMDGASTAPLLINYDPCDSIPLCVSICDLRPQALINYNHNGLNSYTFNVNNSDNLCTGRYKYDWFVNSQLVSSNESPTITLPFGTNNICVEISYFNHLNIDNGSLICVRNRCISL